MVTLWANLPDIGLLIVFKRTSLSDLIYHVGLVCSNWNRLRATELKSRRELVLCQNYTELTPFCQDNPFGSHLIEHVRRDDGTPWMQLQSHDQIKLNALLMPGRYQLLTAEYVTKLVNTLPNITHLTVFYSKFDDYSMNQLNRLLHHWKDNLFSLKLKIGYWWEGTDGLMKMCECINRMSSLRNLKWHSLIHKPKELPILSQLISFAICNHLTKSQWLSSLRQHANGNRDLRAIGCTSFALKLVELVSFEPQFARKFTCLKTCAGQDVQILQLFCDRFKSLKYLSLSVGAMPLCTLARCLSKLPELVHFMWSEPDIHQWENIQMEVVPVSSVRLLSLKLTSLHVQSHLHMEPLNLHQYFPNLQVIILIISAANCSICEYNVIGRLASDIEPELCNRIDLCRRLAMQPFLQCPNLHTIKLDDFSYSKPVSTSFAIDQL